MVFGHRNEEVEGNGEEEEEVCARVLYASFLIRLFRGRHGYCSTANRD